jgi:hypothetical protein
MALGTCPSIAERFLSAASAAVRLCGLHDRTHEYALAIPNGEAWLAPDTDSDKFHLQDFHR